MASVHARVTRDDNRRHRVFGPGWQSRYRARLIQEDDDLRHLLAFTLIAISHFHHPGVEVAVALAKSTSQVSRWLAAETVAWSHDRAEASLIEDLVVNLLKHLQPIARH